jgi:hypothetical protein
LPSAPILPPRSPPIPINNPAKVIDNHSYYMISNLSSPINNKQLGINLMVDYVEFASKNYGDGNLANTNNRNLGNTPAWLVSCPMVVAKSLVLLILASFR